MAKTIRSLIHEAELKMGMWWEIASDPQALKDRDKTKEEAAGLANYYEGRFAALIEARNLSQEL